MSLALYRKYRPATFGELKGQEHVAEPLQQALRNGRIHHAYLFSGPRGCGKTSSARILARSLNCEQGPTPDPCGECDSCVALGPYGSGHIDVIEIDAASHGGVDDARDLRERAFFAPVSARYKVYIIDEAHMVTREGFNALLKLVEEPPPHLKFVFATTEPEKVIGTIRSRTHHYPFRLLPPGTLRELLEEILQKEGVPYEPAAIPLVVRAGAGSARDAESILDQLLAGSGEDGITYARAVSLLGYTDASLLDEVVDAVAARDGGGVFAAVDRVMESGQDPRRFAADLLERFRDLVVLSNVPDAGATGLLDVPPDELERMQAQAARLGPAELARAADLLNTGLTEMRGATSPRLLLELMCARILLPGAYNDEASLLTRLERLERRLAISGGEPGATPRSVPDPGHTAETRATSARPARVAAGSQPPPARGGDPTSSVQPIGGRAEEERRSVDNSTTEAVTGRATPGPGDPPAGRGADSSGPPASASRAAANESRSPVTAGRTAANQSGPLADDSHAATSPSGPAGDASRTAANRSGPPADAGRATAGPSDPPNDASHAADQSGPADPGGPPASRADGAKGSRPGGDADRPKGAPTGSEHARSTGSHQGWPEPARPGVPQGRQDRSESPQPAGEPAVDVSAVRRMWIDILETVKQRSKVAWIVLMEGVEVASLEGNVLTLAFSNEGKRRGFTSGGKDAVLRDALRELLGVDWRIEAVLDNGGGAPPTDRPGPPPPPADWGAPTPTEPPPPAPPAEEPDEADEVDPEGDADADQQAALTGMALIEQELGGRVIQEIETP